MNGGRTSSGLIRVVLAALVAAASSVAFGATPATALGDAPEVRSPAPQVDVIEFASVYGIWSDITGRNGGTPPCGVTEIPFPQEANPATNNTVRFGNPSPGDCDDEDKSGFGFQGNTIAAVPSSADIFNLGKFTHYNNPIDGEGDNVGTGTLTATITFDNLITGNPQTLDVVWDVTLDETDNNASPCAYPDADNSAGCADRVTFEEAAQTQSVTAGETTLTFDIAGFGNVGDPNCTVPTDGQLPTPGSEVTTPEGGEQTACMYGQVKAGTLIIEKTVVGGGAGDDVTFEVQERSQRNGQVGNAIGTPVSVPVDVDGSGVGSAEVELEAGVYSITEGNLPPGVTFDSLECTSVGGDGIALSTQHTGNGPEARVDLDSGETITCSYTNEKEQPVQLVLEKTLVPDTDPGRFDLVASSGEPLAVIGSEADEPDADPATPIEVAIGQEVVLSESGVGSTDLANYGRSILCTYGADGQLTPDGNGTIVVPDEAEGGTITCEFTNTRLTRTVIVQKTWVDAQQGDQADLSVGASTVTSTASGVAGTQADTTNRATAVVPVGQPVTVTEELLDPLGVYSTSLECGASSIALAGTPNAILSGSVPVPPGQDDIVCTFTNTDDSTFDLSVTKSDGLVDGELVTAGDPVVYEIVVTNDGTRDAVDAVSVVDDLPSQFSWDVPLGGAAYGCAAVGQTVTCEIPAAQLEAGESVTITLNAVVNAGVPAGVYTNRVYIDTPEDPVCEGGECVPPTCPTTITNNVACEDTPVDADATLRIVKSDWIGVVEIGDTDTIEPGDSFSYQIVVTNDPGTQAVKDVRVTDTVPASLDVDGISVDGAWDCSASSGNSIDCIYAGPLAPGATASTITVDVTLSSTFAGSQVTNTADAIGTIVKPAPLPQDDQTPLVDDDETTLVDSTFDLSVTKSDGLVDGEFLTAGESIVYEIVVTNDGTRDAVDAVTVVDDLPAQFSWDDPSGGDLYGCAAVAQQVTCEIPAAQLEAGESVTITLNAVVDAGVPADVYTNRVYIDTPEDPVCDGDECTPPTCPTTITNNVACEDTPVDADATLSIVKSDWIGVVEIGDTDTIEPGDSFSYQIVVTNDPGTQSVKDVRVTDTVPASLTVDSVTPGAGWDCSATVGNAIDCTYAGPLAPGASTTVIEIDVTLDSTFAGSEVTNTADAIGTIVKPAPLPQDDQTPLVDDDETTLVDSTFDLSVTKSDGLVDSELVTAGESISYEIVVTNDGTRDAVDAVTVVDDLPSQFSWDVPLGGAAYGCAAVAQQVTCEIPAAQLEAGESVTITLNAVVNAGVPAGVYTNRVYIDTPEDPVCDGGECTPPTCPTTVTNNVACEDTPVDNTATLAIVKDDDVSSVEPGDSFTYTILVTNNGPQPVDNIVVTDTVPAPLTIDAVAGTDWNCSTVANAITCTRAAELGAQVAAPVITVAVTLSPTFVGTTLTNTGIAIADVVKPDGFPPETTDPVDDDVVTPVRSLDVSAFLPECVADSPYIVVDIDALGFQPGDSPITLTFFDSDMNPLWIDANGNIVAGPVKGGTPYTTTVDVDGNPLQLTGQRVLFPGASLDPLDWPGWTLDNGIWVEDPTDDFLRDGVFVQVDINPTALTGLIEYPPATSACANPNQTDLAIVKDGPATPVGAGNEFDWTMTITNNGPSIAEGVVVSDLVPTGVMTVVGVTSTDFTCTRNGNDVTCTRDTLAVGASGTVTIRVDTTATAAGDVQNVATVESETPDSNLANNSDDATAVIVASGAVTTTTLPPPATLPPTGSNSTHQGIVIALWLSVAGLVALGITRRRRTS